MIRIVGLSATLPNYVDVAVFLGVNPQKGLFYFDSGFRPVPLEQRFIGAKKINNPLLMNKICYEKCEELVRQGHQVLVFVHARKDTVRTARTLSEMAATEGLYDLFSGTGHESYDSVKLKVIRSKNKELKELFEKGFGIHHAGMMRSDRDLSEQMFSKGAIKVLVCTATLAWGVNLPAYAVIIKGTQIYDALKGSFVDLSFLDVLQIFGRAGRPQYGETQGVAHIITTHDKLDHYLSLCTQQHPIESKFASNLIDNLNAEIVLGTVSNVEEAIRWLNYTYLVVRMKRNPLVYGMSHQDPIDDPTLDTKRRELIVGAATELHKNQMIVFDQVNGSFTAKDLGRIASLFYVKVATVEIINQSLKPIMAEADVFDILSQASEFSNIRFREGEEKELKKLMESGCCCRIKREIDSVEGKVNVLLQSYVSRLPIDDFGLIMDRAYVAQNAQRLSRAFFEILMHRSWAQATQTVLTVSKCISVQMWPFEHPLGQTEMLRQDIIEKLPMEMENLREMDENELGRVARNNKMSKQIKRAIDSFPLAQISAKVIPLTDSILKITMDIEIIIGNGRWWVWVEDGGQELHFWQQITKSQQLECTIPVSEPLPAQIHVRLVSDDWLNAEAVCAVSFKHLILPDMITEYTPLLDLQPLPVTALQDKDLESLYRFRYFNPVQTQVFFALYHTSQNVLIGAPTGSGKTIMAELAIWNALKKYPKFKVVYIAPMKALVRERMMDWTKRLSGVVELTGEETPSHPALQKAQIIVTTPEKWDGISRGWQFREYVQQVSAVILDEIHLLGSERGPVI